MRDEYTGLTGSLVKPIVRFAIGLVVLLIIRALVPKLPMIREAVIGDFPLSPLQIIFVVIDTIIIVILLIFRKEISEILSFCVRRFPGVIKTVIMSVVCLIAVSIASFSISLGMGKINLYPFLYGKVKQITFT